MEEKAETLNLRVFAPNTAFALFLDDVGLTPPSRVQQLSRPPAPDFTSPASSAPYNEQARLLLAGQKAAENGLHAPERRLRHRLSVSRLRDSGKRFFSKHDVAVVFDSLVFQTPLPPPGLAQAVLNQAARMSLDELWRDLGDTGSRPGRSGPSTVGKVPWLNTVTKAENLDYVRLMCHYGVSQGVLDDALGLALHRNSFPTVELLLRYGACASAHIDLIRGRFKSDNVRLARCLLASPSAMGVEEWQYCLNAQTTSAPTVLALCLVHYPDLASAPMLLEALGSANLLAIAIMLHDSRTADSLRNVSVEACRRAHVIESNDTRYKVLAMLTQAGMIRNTTFIQSELARAVRLRQFALVRILVNAGVSLGADANNALCSAITGMAFDILELFANGGSAPPLGPALDYIPDSASEQEILRLLFIFRDHLGQPCDPLHRQLIRAVQDQRIALVQKLLSCGAAVDFQECEAVKEAIRKVDLGTLKILLDVECSQKILSEAIPIAINPHRFKGQALELLLSSATFENAAAALRNLWDLAKFKDNPHITSIIPCFLMYGLDVNVDNGSLLCFATQRQNGGLLDLLIGMKPAWSSITAACHTLLSSPLASKQKQSMFQRLIDGAAEKSAPNESELLAFSLAKHPDCTELPALLLSRGAEPNFEACQSALEKISVDRYITLISHIKTQEVASRVFNYVVKTSLLTSAKYRIYGCLLLKGILNKEISAALVHHLKPDYVKDLRLLELLLEHGADVGYESGMIFRRALLGFDSVDAFTFLIRHIKDATTAGIALAMTEKLPITQIQRITIYRSLLQKWDVRGHVIQGALVSLLKSAPCDLDVLQMLLRKGANPNKGDAQCFILACIANAHSEFRALSSEAEIHVVAKALIIQFRAEDEVIKWLGLCFEGHPPLKKLEDNQLLFQCIRKFPGGTRLLNFLLKMGVSASTTILHPISEGWPPEQCTALLWALSKPRVDNKVILTLLERGGKAALPAYSTPLKEVSAAFLCMMDRSRTDILKALLRFDSDKVLSYEIPGRSFEHLAISPAVPDTTLSHFTARLPLHLAALFLGNFDAYRLVSIDRLPNDGLLHNAAFLALPEFVEWCLKTDDPNARHENFDDMIPLAVACDAKYMPCCKIGNEREFRTRQRETIQQLVPRSDLEYSEKHKTPLHIALHSGPETTAALLDALSVIPASKKHTLYRYTDQKGRPYTSREYVMEIMGCEPERKDALLACLRKADL